MLKQLPRILVVAAALLGMVVKVPAQEKSDEQAREAARRFFQGFKGKNLEGLMKATDVPFCREGGMNFQKRDDLKQFLQKGLESRDCSKDTIRITRVVTLPKLEKTDGKFTDEERKAFHEVLGKEHRIVEVEWTRFGQGKHVSLILVRFQKGEAKVVGII